MRQTHLQKATYFLQKLFDRDLDFEFILYKHGPFSFELRDELMKMGADGLIRLEQQPYPYGPTLAPTDAGQQIKATLPQDAAQPTQGDQVRGRPPRPERRSCTSPACCTTSA